MSQKPSFLEQHTCPWWLDFLIDNPIRKLINNPQQILTGLIKPGQVALDIGCGVGYFTIELARMVGKDGRVIAVDLQQEMLERVRRRALKMDLFDRIDLRQCKPDALGVTQPVDFILAAWMIHEVRQPAALFREIHALLKPGGNFLMIEPLLHVSTSAFQKSLTLAGEAGFVIQDQPKIAFNATALFSR